VHGDGKDQRPKYMRMERTRGQSAWGWKGPEVKVDGDGKDQRSKYMGMEWTKGQSAM
jgi:hypothetical protein